MFQDAQFHSKSNWYISPFPVIKATNLDVKEQSIDFWAVYSYIWRPNGQYMNISLLHISLWKLPLPMRLTIPHLLLFYRLLLISITKSVSSWTPNGIKIYLIIEHCSLDVGEPATVWISFIIFSVWYLVIFITTSAFVVPDTRHNYEHLFFHYMCPTNVANTIFQAWYIQIEQYIYYEPVACFPYWYTNSPNVDCECHFLPKLPFEFLWVHIKSG